MIRPFILSRAKREAVLRALLPLAAILSLAPGAVAQQIPATGKPGAKPAATSAKNAAAKTSDKPEAKPADAKKDAKGKGKDAKSADKKGAPAPGGGKPVQVGTYGDWGAYTAQGKDKTCYALASPKDRAPNALKRDPAYVFISSRPGENVRNEISIIMGFAMKDDAEAKAEIGNDSYDLVAKGTNAWVKNPAKEPQFIDAMKKGSKLIVKAPSVKGNVTTDSYSLAGLSQALDKVQKECP
ncbi:MAG: hypothetical protein NVSMB26_28670 [Beijerinckiaceae bacterium]